MTTKKTPPKQITIQNCNIKVEPSIKALAQLALAEAMKSLADSLGVEDKHYGIYIEGDQVDSK